MIESWFLFAIIATLVWSTGAILVKFVRANYIKSPIGYLVLAAPVTLAAFIFFIRNGIQTLPLKLHIYIIITTIAAFAGYWLYLVAIHKEEVSRIVTLEGLQPLFVLVLSTIFLKEILTIKDYIAFPLIIGGSMMISLRRIDQKLRMSEGLMIVTVSIFMFSIHDIFLKLAAEVDYFTMMALREFWFLAILVIFFISSKTVREKTREDFKQLSKKRLLWFYLAEICGITGVVFTFLAVQRGPVSLVVLVESTQTLFVIGLAVLLSIFIPRILKEEITKKTIGLKIISAVMMIGGLYLIGS